MKKILLLSDTHGCLDDFIIRHAKEADEVWHAGDIGNLQVSDQLQKLRPLKAIHGNIDDHLTRMSFPEYLHFETEGLSVLMLHIAGVPGRYKPRAKELLAKYAPRVFICGHSHLLKIVRDPLHQHLHMNPGAAGTHGFHKVRTMVRFRIQDGRMESVDVIKKERKNISTQTVG